MRGAIFFVVQHQMNISISWQLTACLSSTPQPRTDLQRHNYIYPAVPLLSPPFIPSSLHLYVSIASLTLCLSEPYLPLLLPRFFALPPSTAFVIDR